MTTPGALQVGDELELEIEDLAFGGDGVGAAVDGMRIFVPFAAVGDRLRVRITQRKKRFARAEIAALLHPAPQRTKPACVHFGSCGGCDYQHLTYEAEVAAKVAQLENLLTRVAQLEAPSVEPVVSAPRPLGYRNKVTLQQCPTAEDGPLFGYVGHDNKTIVPVGACPLALEGINERLATTYLQEQERRRLQKHKRIQLRQESSGRVSLSTGPSKKPRRVTERALSRELSIPLDSFYQVNPAVFHRLLQFVEQDLLAWQPSTLLDLYCGCGAFSLALADHVRHVCGVESSRPSLGAARFNATKLGLEHCTFIHAKTEDVLMDVLDAAPDLATSFVILDPPRTGCAAPVIEALRTLPVGRLIYVACDAAKLSRDLRALCADNLYELEQIALFDMFPRTAHFETVAILRSNCG